MRRIFILYFQKTYEMITGKDSLPPNLFLTAVDLLYPGFLEQASRELWTSAWTKVSHRHCVYGCSYTWCCTDMNTALLIKIF